MRTLLTLLLVLALPGLAGADGVFALSPTNTEIHFAIRHLGISSAEGTFTQFTGTLRYGAAASDVSVEVTVDPASIDSGVGLRDRAVRSSYLEVAKFPQARFTASGLRTDGGKEALPGTLELHGVTRPITLRIVEQGHTGRPFALRRSVTALVELSRKDFGISGTGAFLTMADTVRLRIEVRNPAAP
jgi:polyisoprenoid-binding protein YceI